MAFGIKRSDLNHWKQDVSSGKIAFLTHYWQDKRFPNYSSVTKVGCNSLDKLVMWGEQYNLSSKWIHDGKYPHFDLMGWRQYMILREEGLFDHIDRFNLIDYEHFSEIR